MRTIVQDKYFLRDLHREIDLYDRKLIHMEKHEPFETETEREAAVRKMTTKRDSLVTTARTLQANGIEFAGHELPRSLRPEGWVDPRVTVSVAATEAMVPENTPVSVRAVGEEAPHAAGFGGAVERLRKLAPLGEDAPLAAALGSWQDDLLAYRKKRRKSSVAA